jgi:hypothetical protein
MATRKKSTKAPAKTIKDEVVRMRIPGDQKAALEEFAASQELSLSAWLRRLALREAGLLPSAKGER